MALELISKIVTDYSSFLKDQRTEEDEMITNILSEDTELMLKLDNIIKYLQETYANACIFSEWPTIYRDQSIHRLYKMMFNLKKDLINFLQMHQSEESVINILSSKYNTFVDHAPHSLYIIKCTPIGFKNLSIALSDKIFDNLSIERAMKIKDLHITSKMIDKVVSYILTSHYEYNNDLPIESKDINHRIMEEKILNEIIDESKQQSIRYIKEMTIEYNQIEERDKLIDMYENGYSLDYILEKLKGDYHSSWRNNRDFCWIAKDEPDYEKEYELILD